MNRAAEARAAAWFVVAGLAGAGLCVAYVQDASTPVLGGLLALAFAGLCFGLVTWANRLMPRGPFEQEREPLPSAESSIEATEADFRRGATALGRRTLLGRALGFAAVTTGAAVLLPLRSLGPKPGGALGVTPWARNRRAVNEQGKRVQSADVPVGGIVTIFPEGHPGSADGQAVLIHLEPGLVPGDFIAFSRVCTHAGCPVALYEAADHQLLCPCHQSAFDVLHDAKPVFGPAGAPLPQLPIEIDADGFVYATSDFTQPVGPAYWHRG